MIRHVILLLAGLSWPLWAADDAVIMPSSGITASPVVDNPITATDAITVPRMLSYQGRLTDSFDIPVPDTTYQVTFRLYTVPSGGSPFWNETQTVRTRAGLFSVLLGSVDDIDSIPQAGNLYLGMQVGGGAELSPRLRLVSTAYSYNANNAARLDGNDLTALDSRYVNEGQASSVTSAMITDGAVGTADIANIAVTSAKIGNGEVTMAKINQSGAATGQVIKWNGSQWAPANDSVGGGGTGDNAWVRGTPDSVLFTIRRLGIARGGSGNLLYGDNRTTHTNFGVACTTGTSGQSYYYCTVGGGVYNAATGAAATVAGGSTNRASGYMSTVGGGRGNRAMASEATVAGGDSNMASGNVATVAGGYGNMASGYYATVAGGRADTAKGYYCGVLSGYSNLAGDAAADTAATVAGGYDNSATAIYATVGGGYNNTASGVYSAVGGGAYNVASGGAAMVGCGGYNTASGYYSTVGGGYNNTAFGSYATVAGGDSNQVFGLYATVGGGRDNTASGSYAAIGGGYSNVASGDTSTVAGGSYNGATGFHAAIGGGCSNVASGYYSTVPGGYGNSARSATSFAAGKFAKARDYGSFVWSDAAVSLAESVYTTGSNQFRVRARGGTWFFSNAGMTTGVTLAGGSNSWASVCDSANKEDFKPVDRRALLEKLASLRVRDYKMRDQNDGTRHIGPVAQDFHAAFGFGETNTAINMADMDGVTLAAIQALYEQVKAQQAEIDALKAELRRR
ncbi:MAG: tail fiber domain-containing protein [candidate division WOR-3 bacterium]